MRDSAKPRALQRQIEFLNDKGAGKAADKKVLLEAADRILERDSDRRQGVTVNVGVTAQITPGYVIRLPPKREPAVIEGEVAPAEGKAIGLKSAPEGRLVAGHRPPTTGEDAV